MASIAFLRATTARLRRLFSSLIWSSVSLSSLLRICIDDRVTDTSSYIFLYVSCSSFASRVRRWRRDRSHVTDAPRPPGTAQLSNCISVSQVIMSLFLFSISISIYLSFGSSANGGFTGALFLGSPVLALSPSTLHKVPRSEPPPPVSYAETASQPHPATVPGILATVPGSPATVPGSPATVPGSPAPVPGGFAAGLFTHAARQHHAAVCLLRHHDVILPEAHQRLAVLRILKRVVVVHPAAARGAEHSLHGKGE